MKQATIAALLALSCSLAAGGEISFATKPSVSKEGGGVKIRFAVNVRTDVEVAVLDSGGKVVRHLAAGVVGADRAAPPLAKGLSQELVWDGRDDFKKPAKGAPFKVRVRAGTGTRLGRFIGGSPYVFGQPDSIAADEQGNIYVTGFGGPANQCQKTLRVFSPAGKYLRTVLPFPADLPPGSMKEVARWDEAAKAWRPRNLSQLNPEFYYSNNGYANYTLLSVSGTKGIKLINGDAVYELTPKGAVAGNSFSTGQKPWPIFDRKDSNNNHYGHPFHYYKGPLYYTASLDGKWVYMSGPIPNQKRVSESFPMSGVFRMRLDGKDEMKLFVHIPAAYGGHWSQKGNTDYGKTGPVHGVGTDAKGNVYICDREKDRVAVFSEDGKPVGEIAVKNPDLVNVHPETGAVYVIRRFCNGWGTHHMELLKFKNFEKGATPVASFTKFHPTNWPKVALSASGGKTRLWIAGAATMDSGLPRRAAPRGVVVLEDTGAAFKVVPVALGEAGNAQETFARIAADAQRDEIYVSDGVNQIWRYDGKTGKGRLLTKGGKPFYAPDLTVGYDGLLYVRSGEGYSGPLERVTRDLKPAAFSGIGSNRLYDIYGRYGIGFCEKGVGVGPDGKVYDCWMYGFAKYFVSGWGADGKPLKGKYMAGQMKTSKPVYLDIKLPAERKIDSAIVGPVPAANGGMRVDLDGNIYMGLRLLPAGHTPSPGFEKDPAYKSFTGSIVKFHPGGGAVLGIADSKSEDAKAPRLATLDKRVTVEGALAMYPGVAPFSGGGFGGNTSCCVCRVSRFDLDRYGRLALPNVVTASVRVVDNAGNLITEIGSYGNYDSQHVNPDTEAGKGGEPTVTVPAIPMSWPTGAGFSETSVYVCDTYNRRVVRADFSWKVEATCAVGGTAVLTPRAPAPAAAAAAARPGIRETAPASSAAGPRTAPRTAKTAARSPEQVCTGWFSAASNYRKVGMKEDARRCLSNIVRAYPDTEWAARARAEMSRL